MVGHGGSSVGSYLADPTSPIPSHCASIVATSTLRVKKPHSLLSRFRRLHEQLTQVIVRVLRPATTAPRPGSPTQEGDASPAQPAAPAEEQPAMDAADANAIQEVNLAYDNVKQVDCLDVSKEGNDSWEGAVKRYILRQGTFLLCNIHLNWSL